MVHLKVMGTLPLTAVLSMFIICLTIHYSYLHIANIALTLIKPTLKYYKAKLGIKKVYSDVLTSMDTSLFWKCFLILYEGH